MHRRLLSLPQTRGNYLRTSGGVLCRRRSAGTRGDGEQALRASERESREGDWHLRNKVFHLRRAINGLKHICSLGEDTFILREAVSRRIPFTHCSVFVKIQRWRATVSSFQSGKLGRSFLLCVRMQSRERKRKIIYVYNLFTLNPCWWKCWPSRIREWPIISEWGRG